MPEIESHRGRAGDDGSTEEDREQGGPGLIRSPVFFLVTQADSVFSAKNEERTTKDAKNAKGNRALLFSAGASFAECSSARIYIQLILLIFVPFVVTSLGSENGFALAMAAKWVRAGGMTPNARVREGRFRVLGEAEAQDWIGRPIESDDGNSGHH